MAPKISVKPSKHLLVDESLQIQINNLESTQNVTVYAYLEEEGKRFESCGSFTADESGTVALSKDKSVSGTYTGVSSMGLFWSMVPCPGQMEGIRMMKKNLDTPFTTLIKVFNGHLSLDEVKDETLQEIGSTTVERWYKHPGVTCCEVEEGSVRGKLYLPPGRGPFPGVIDMFGTAGGLTETRSALLASRGIASLALPYFLYKDLPTSLFKLNLDYFLEAIDWLITHEKIIKTGIGVIGESKGGDIALIMAAHSPKIRAVVNINGCTFNSTAPLKYSGGDIPEVRRVCSAGKCRIAGKRHNLRKMSHRRREMSMYKTQIKNDLYGLTHNYRFRRFITTRRCRKAQNVVCKLSCNFCL